MVPSTGRDVLSMHGAESLDLLNRISTNALGTIAPGEVRTTLLITEKGRMVDLVHVMPRPDGALLLTSAGAGESVRRWISRFIIMEDILVEQPEAPYNVAALAGPHALAAARDSWGVTLSPGQSASLDAPGGTTTLLALSEFGSDWVYVISPATELPEPPRRPRDLPVLDPPACEILRILRGMPAFGNEITEQFNPYDLGLTFAVSYSKGCYVGQEVIARLDTYNKAQRHLLGLHIRGARTRELEGQALLLDGADVGVVTSAARVGAEALGLGVIRKAVGPGAELTFGNAAGPAICRTFSVPVPADRLGSFDMAES
jgi:folate-binding protein YgfZ